MNPIRTLVFLALVIAGLTGLDRFLARTEMAEVQSGADRSWRNGTRLLQQGHAEEALDALRNAHALARENLTYELDMISAMTALGRTDDADPLMDEVLLRKPNDGAANLMAARLKAKERDVKDAEAFYHRAIYGEWPADPAARSRDARFELVQLLASRNSRQQLLAELISLEAAADGNDDLQRRIAHLLLVADSPSRAATVYRDLIEKNPDDAEAYEGLGEAELRLGQYRAARASFVQVSYKNPQMSVGPRLVLLNEVIQLDPTPRRLATAEKYGRSVRILALAKGDLEGLLAQRPAAGTVETARLLKAAADSADSKPSAPTNELAEQKLDLAEQIWKARVLVFGPSTGPAEEVLRLMMERLAS
jgi:tetratricopeptide (TPR) repeat protein